MIPTFFSDTKTDERLNDDIVRKTDDLGEDMLEEALARDTDTIPDVATEQFCLQSLSNELEFQRNLHLCYADASVCSAVFDAGRYCNKYDILALDTMSESIVGCESLFPGTEGASEWLKRFKDAALRLLRYIKEKFFDMVNMFKKLFGMEVKPTKDIVQQTVDASGKMSPEQLKKMADTVATILQNTVPEVTEQNKNTIVSTFVRAVAEKIDYTAITDYANEISGTFLLYKNIDQVSDQLLDYISRIHGAHSRFSQDKNADRFDALMDEIPGFLDLFSSKEYVSLFEAGYTNPSNYSELARHIHNEVLTPLSKKLRNLEQTTNRIESWLNDIEGTEDEKSVLKLLQSFSAITTDISRMLKMVGITYLTIGPRYNEYVRVQTRKAMNGHAPGESSGSEWWNTTFNVGTEGISDALQHGKKLVERAVEYILDLIEKIGMFFRKLIDKFRLKTTKQVVKDVVQREAEKSKATVEDGKISRDFLETIAKRFDIQASTTEAHLKDLEDLVEYAAKKLDTLGSEEYAASTKGKFVHAYHLTAVKRTVFDVALRAIGAVKTIERLDVSDLEAASEDAKKMLNECVSKDEVSLDSSGYGDVLKYYEVATTIRDEVIRPCEQWVNTIRKGLKQMKSAAEEHPEDDRFKKCIVMLTTIISQCTAVLRSVGTTYLAVGPKYMSWQRKALDDFMTK